MAVSTLHCRLHALSAGTVRQACWHTDKNKSVKTARPSLPYTYNIQVITLPVQHVLGTSGTIQSRQSYTYKNTVTTRATYLQSKVTVMAICLFAIAASKHRYHVHAPTLTPQAVLAYKH